MFKNYCPKWLVFTGIALITAGVIILLCSLPSWFYLAFLGLALIGLGAWILFRKR
ncbi:MAG: intracellular growth attenuator family protein [Clostridiales bacterium]|nr:intracellular growth attenuator family protein [Clostridiales bacterium]MBQ4637286.1 LPXTG cell wall anchor domain-containing protein [Clostridia bacterium]